MAFVCISLPHLFPYLTSRQALPLLSRYLLDASEVQKDTPWFRFPENAFCLSANEARRSRSSRFSSGHGCYVDGDGDPRGLWRSPAAHAAFYGLRSPRLVPRFASVTSRLARSSRQRVVAAGMVGDERRYLRGRSQAGWFVVGVARKNSCAPWVFRVRAVVGATLPRRRPRVRRVRATRNPASRVSEHLLAPRTRYRKPRGCCLCCDRVC